MEKQRLEDFLNMPEYDLIAYENETTITHISFSIYQVHSVDPMLFCVDTSAPHSFIGDKALERIFRHSGRKSVPIIDSKPDFKFGETLVRLRSAVELLLPTPVFTLEI